ncbi:hypothetical protein [Anaerovibrio sp.]|uniref:hypothetical protein n=1 Tax=Anaerovibrio sp. TaxID=1872532 RepID=UPI00388D5129
MKEPPVDRAQLIAELKTVASWKEEFIVKENELKKSQIPDFPTYEEFVTKNTSNLSGGCFFMFVFALIYYGGFIYTYYKTNLFPDGFLAGVIIFILAFFLGLFLLVILGVKMDGAREKEKEDKDKWHKLYQEKKNRYDVENKEREKIYFHNLSIFEDVRQRKPDTFIPEQYQEPNILKILIGYIENYRANTFAEAINLYHTEKHDRVVDEKVDNVAKMAERAAEAADRAASAASSAAWHASQK